MFKVNEYFDGKVKSIGFQNAAGIATLGVMAPGDYEFGTSTVEYMTVVSGSMRVLLPDATEWQTYAEGETFVVADNSRFKLTITEETAYKCLYK